MSPSRRIQLIQGVSDLGIPLLGYFFWHWDLYFILLFFLLDYLASCVMVFLRDRKIRDYKNIPAFPLKNLLLTLGILTVTLLLVFRTLLQVLPSFDPACDTWDFLAYTELGIPQGILLLPLIGYSAFAQYRMSFVTTGQFRVIQPAEIWKAHFRTMLIVLAISAVATVVSGWLVLPQVWYTLLLVTGVSAYRFFAVRNR